MNTPTVPNEWIVICPYLQNLKEFHCGNLPFESIEYVTTCLNSKLSNTGVNSVHRFFTWALAPTALCGRTPNELLDWMYISDYLLMENEYSILLKQFSQVSLPQLIHTHLET